MLMRFDPFRDVDRLAQCMPGSLVRDQLAPMDVYRRGGDYFVHLDLPGVDPSSIDVQVDRGVLTVRAARTVTRHGDDEWLRAERPSGEAFRQLHLGEAVDVDGIEASYVDGVLTLRIPIAAAAKPRRIAVNPQPLVWEAEAVSSDESAETTAP